MFDARSEGPSRTRPTTGLRWAIGVAATLTIFSPVEAGANASTSGLSTRPASKSAPLLNPLLRGNGKLTGNYEIDLRNLAGDDRPLASRRLVQLSMQHGVLNSPTRRLALVRALAKHESRLAQNEGVHLEVLRALIRLFVSEDETHQEGVEPHLESGVLRHLIRGSAAMALARSQHPLALKKLIATALSGGQLDPVGARLAVTALRSLEPESLHTPPLARLFSAEAIDRITRPSDGERSISMEDLTPVSLIETAQAESSARRKRPDDQTVDSEDPPSFQDLLFHLKRSVTLPRAFTRVRAWEAAYEKDSVWTLRTLALLGTRLETRVLSWGRKRALEATRASSEVERSAGAWCVATIAPDAVADLLEKNDGVITRAILRQASEGEVAETVAAFLKKRKIDSKAAHLAFRMVLQDPERWSNFSTKSLREYQSEHGAAVLAALASRLRSAEPGLGPNIIAARSWLNSPSGEIRSAAALGLSHASESSALGLLFWAYLKESNPLARRAIVASIARTPLAKSPEFLDLLAIDPETGCRALLNESEERNSTGLYLGWSVRRTATVTDREGRAFQLAPAPDGFVGIVRSSF